MTQSPRSVLVSYIFIQKHDVDNIVDILSFYVVCDIPIFLLMHWWNNFYHQIITEEQGLIMAIATVNSDD